MLSDWPSTFHGKSPREVTSLYTHLNRSARTLEARPSDYLTIIRLATRRIRDRLDIVADMIRYRGHIYKFIRR